MPEPNRGTDVYIYRLTKKIAPYLCDISPNWISFLGFLFIIPIIYNLQYQRSVGELIILVFLRQFLDCLDGTVARKCQGESKFGAKLDVFLDTLSTLITIIYLIFVLLKEPSNIIWGKQLVKIALVLALLVFICYIVYEAYQLIFLKYTLGQKIDQSKTLIVLHDNSTLSVLIITGIIKYLISTLN